MTRTHSFVLAATTLVAAVSAQELASYDPAAGPDQEFAAVSCFNLSSVVDDLVSPGPANDWFRGATAADNPRGRLYYATGRSAHGILRIDVGDIGTGALPTQFGYPAGLTRITGIEVDPRGNGDWLFVTGGSVLGSIDVSTGNPLAAPIAIPLLASRFATGLAYNAHTDRLFVVDDASTIYALNLANMNWSAPVSPAVPVPGRATGIAFCSTAPGTPYVSYYNGIVMDPLTGQQIPFPGAPGGNRHHRGLTFLATGTVLEGSEPPPPGWELEMENGFQAGSASSSLVVESPQLGVLLMCLGGGTDPITPPSFVEGQLWVDPATTVTRLVGSGQTIIPLSLVGVPPGIGLTFQALDVHNGQGELSDALHIITYL